jgi:hypothetical protein
MSKSECRKNDEHLRTLAQCGPSNDRQGRAVDVVREFKWRCLLNGLPKPTRGIASVVSRAFDYDREFHAEELVQAFAAEPMRLSRATVFRALDRLVRVGMLSQDGFAFRLTLDPWTPDS